MKEIHKDHTHGLRRVLQRAFKADPYISRLLHTVILGKGSMIRLVQFSAHAKHTFNTINRQCGAADTVASDTVHSIYDFSIALHHFDSITTPTMQATLFLRALLGIAQQLLRLRRSTSEHGSCLRFLEFMDWESCLQLGMVADASYQLMVLLRRFDDELTDPGLWKRYICDDFLRTCAALFLDGMCFEIHGFTRHIIDILETPIVVQLTKKRVKTIGGGKPPADVMARCIGRKASWLSVGCNILKGRGSRI